MEEQGTPEGVEEQAEAEEAPVESPIEAAEAVTEGEEPEGAVAEAEEAAVDSGEAAEEAPTPELYDEDGYPADLPVEFHEYFVEQESRKDGPWSWVAQPGLDIEEEEVQRLAYGLLQSKYSWKVAMFGGTKRVENVRKEGKRGGVSLGEDGRWFASPMDVVDAAKAWMKANELPDWRLTRNRSVA